MPYYHDKLCSAWGNDRVFEIGKPTGTEIDLPKGSRRGPGNIGYMAPNLRNVHRNQATQTPSAEANGDSAMEPKYLSDKSRGLANGENGQGDIKDLKSTFARFALSSHSGDAPHGFGELRIRYGGPRGVHDFDFG